MERQVLTPLLALFFCSVKQLDCSFRLQSLSYPWGYTKLGFPKDVYVGEHWSALRPRIDSYTPNKSEDYRVSWTIQSIVQVVGENQSLIWGKVYKRTIHSPERKVALWSSQSICLTLQKRLSHLHRKVHELLRFSFCPAWEYLVFNKAWFKILVNVVCSHL